MIGGQISGGLLVLDFDEVRFYLAWVELVGDLAGGLPVHARVVVATRFLPLPATR